MSLPCSLSDVDAYLQMATIRAFEVRCLELSAAGTIAGSIHLCLGQEAIPVGALAGLAPADRVVATYRGHGWAIACGVPLTELLGEICHRVGGVNGGRGGSAYLWAPSHRLFGENSIVGAGVPIACGLALSAVRRGDDSVAVVSVGDGALNQGSAHEGLVFAAARNLPIVVVCEANGWSEMTPTAEMVRGSLADRVAGYGIATDVIDGNDPRAVSVAVARAAERARDGGGPAFLECQTSRLGGHYNKDIEQYRSEEDRQRAVDEDPIVKLRVELVAAGEDVDALDAEAARVIDAAVAVVDDMPLADASSASSHVWAPSAPIISGEEPIGPSTTMTYQLAVNEALRTELAARPELVVYGEDVGVAGGVFGVTRRLQREFGVDRVFDTPIAESAILGSAVGAAMTGLRPVVEIMWADFLLVALDQLVNQAANVRYVTRGELSVPIVVRVQQGATPGSCPQHSQSLEAILAHVPGLKVGLPATPADAYEMVRAAIADDGPVVVIEARALYQESGPVQPVRDAAPVLGARLRRAGTTAGIVTWGTMVAPALAAADSLAESGLQVAVLDLRWLAPLDMSAIESLVRATSGRIVIAHEANVTGGFGAEIAARIGEAHLSRLRAPIVRVGAPDVRIPAAPTLQAALIPDSNAIETAVRSVVYRSPLEDSG